MTIAADNMPHNGGKMINHWDEFKVAPSSSAPMAMRVSLTKDAILSLNARARNVLGDPTHVVLYFDRINSLIGIRPAEAGLHYAYPLRPWGQSNTRIVRAKKFCRYHGIRTDTTVIFDEPRICDRGYLVLDLKYTHSPNRSEKRQAEKAARRALSAVPYLPAT